MRRSLVLATALALSAPADAALIYSRTITTTSGEVVFFDTDTNTVLRTFAVPFGDVDGLAQDPASGDLFVGTSNGNGLFRLNLSTGAVTTVLSGVSPSGLAFGPSGDLFFANQSFPAPATVVRFDVASGVVEGTFPNTPNGNPVGLAFGPTGDLFVSSLGTGAAAPVARINPNTGAFLQGYAAGLSNPYELEFGPDGTLFVANFGAGNVVRLNTATGATSVLRGGLAFPRGLAFGPDGNLYVTSGTDILALNPTTGATVNTIPVGTTGGAQYLTFGALPAAVPEPASLAAAGVGGLTLLAARRVRDRGRATAAAGR
jgi:streptogramin lyase